MKIFIGYDYNKTILSVLLAENIEKANLVWMGMGESPHEVEEIDPNEKNIGMHGVLFLITSEEGFLQNSDSRKIRTYKRGS